MLFVWLTTVSGAWGDTPSVPVVRYAYTVMHGKPSKDARLEDHVEVVLCKSEYDRWMQGPHIPPNIALHGRQGVARASGRTSSINRSNV